MHIETYAVGPLQDNCIILSDEESKEAMVVDPGDEPDRITDYIRDAGLKVKYILCTHGHFDHIGAVGDLKKETGAAVVLHADEVGVYQAQEKVAAMWGFDLEPQPQPDLLVKEGDILTLGDAAFHVLHTPGHSPGGICLYGEGIVVTGDTLFAGSIGRTDLPGGDYSKLRESFVRLMTLPDNTVVLPGHGLETTIGRERKENMFADEFLL